LDVLCRLVDQTAGTSSTTPDFRDAAAFRILGSADLDRRQRSLILPETGGPALSSAAEFFKIFSVRPPFVKN